MKKNNRLFAFFVVIAVLLLAAVIGSGIYVNYYQNRTSYEDKNGWFHNAEGGVYESDPYAGLNYVRIPCDKEEFSNMTAHQFIEKITPVLKAYKGKNYVTFDFGDGTGIYWAFSDLTYDGVYGNLDEAGVTIDTQYIIAVNGTRVTATEGSPFDSMDSINMYAYLPSGYYNDSAFVLVNQGLLFISVDFDNSTLSYEAAANELWAAFQKADLSKIEHVVICMNDDIYYVVNEEGNVVEDPSAYDTYFDLIFGEDIEIEE